MNETHLDAMSAKVADEAMQQQKGVNSVASAVVGIASGAFLVLFFEPVWPVAFGVVGVSFASALVLCFLWWQRDSSRK